MHYLLSFTLGNNQTDISLKGTIYDNENNVVDDVFDQGVKLDLGDKRFTIIVNKKGSLISKRSIQDKISTSVINAGFLFLISPKVCQLFESIGITNLQYIDVEIKDGDNYIFKDYKIVNILNKIDCINVEESTVNFFSSGNIDTISNLVIYEDKVPKDIKIFLLGKSTTGVVIIHQSLKEAIEQEGLTGFTFYTLDEAGVLY